MLAAHLSGRKIGCAATDFVLKTLHTGSYKTKDFEVNYVAKTRQKTFSSSSYFIKNESGEVVGTLCINIDTQPYRNATALMNQFIKNVVQEAEPVAEAEEQLFGNTQEIIQSMVEQAIGRLDVPLERLSASEKIGIVKELVNRGAFQLRGAASEISQALGVSEPTIYRYLNKVK